MGAETGGGSHGGWERALVGAGSLGSRRPVLAGAGLGALALVCVLAVAVRPARVVAAIEAVDAPPGSPAAIAAAKGEPLPDGDDGETPAPPKKQYATPDELDSADTLPKLVVLGEQYPEDPAVLKRLAIAHSGKGDHSAAIRAVRKLSRLSADTTGEDAIVQVVQRAAAGSPEVQELAFELMQDGMGPGGPDLLFELATTTATPKPARDRAERALASEPVRKLATPALLVAMDLRATKSSCERKKLFPRARDEGDARSLPFLTPLLATSGCGFLGTGDCLKCLGGRQDLREAITAIQARAKTGK